MSRRALIAYALSYWLLVMCVYLLGAPEWAMMLTIPVGVMALLVLQPAVDAAGGYLLPISMWRGGILIVALCAAINALAFCSIARYGLGLSKR